jgi:GR25 family glycosyltransferase involved in LPS biosynthesis
VRASLPVYYINLDNRPDRRAFMERQLARLGLNATRIAAVPAGEPAPAAIAAHVDPAGARYLGPLVTACAMSHLLCWTAFVAEPDAPPWALVLEDDGILSDALPAFLEEFLPVADSLDADAVQLETRRRPVRVFPHHVVLPSGRKLARFRSARDGGACYLISRRAVSILLARSDLFEQPIDLTLFRPFLGPGRAIRPLLVEPALCIQLDEVGSAAESSRSDLSESRLAAERRDSRLLRHAYVRTINFFDHLAHLPRGLRKRVIPFDGDPARHG